MRNYEAKKPSYFATPSPQLIHALHTALEMILSRPLADRFARHAEVSARVKKVVDGLGLKQVASRPEDQSHGMTAIMLPDGLQATDVLPKVVSAGAVFAGGIHKELGQRYIRFGHMGVSVVSELVFVCYALVQVGDVNIDGKFANGLVVDGP
jgi:alanine-glyoxylate transaminase/serine-glyoxylate transaminase/serine-pyruvate transaminase